MQSILIVGAGKEGKGFLGQVFHAAGWEVFFMDKDPQVIRAMSKGEYVVKLFQADGTFETTVCDYTAFLCEEKDKCFEVVEKVDLIALCLYPEDIPESAAYLAPCIEARLLNNQKPLTILSCTNKNHLIPQIESWFLDGIVADEAKQLFQKNVAVRDVIVRRAVGADSSSSLYLEALTVATMLIQPPIFADLSEVPWMELQDNIEILKELKLYTINAAHVTGAFLGYLKGYTTIENAETDPEVIQLIHNVVSQAIKGLAAEHGISESIIWAFYKIPAPKETLVDHISRVAYDPIRKLSRNDRLCGNLLLCHKHGFPYDAIVASIANGFCYSEPSDPAALKIQAMIRNNGIEQAVENICELPVGSLLNKEISDAYRVLQQLK